MPKTRLPLAPGQVLQHRILDRLKVTQADLANAMGISPVRVNLILKDRAPISAEVALRLGQVTSTVPAYWLQLQIHCDLFHARSRLQATLVNLPPLTKVKIGDVFAGVRAEQPQLLGEILNQQLLLPRQITQQDLAHSMDVSHVTVHHIVRGKRSLTAEMALRLARVTKTKAVDWLLLQADVDLLWTEKRLRMELGKLPKVASNARDGEIGAKPTPVSLS